jgi:hypothetical protein
MQLLEIGNFIMVRPPGECIREFEFTGCDVKNKDLTPFPLPLVKEKITTTYLNPGANSPNAGRFHIPYQQRGIL